jgi:putative addiction module CopG family antidote
VNRNVAICRETPPCGRPGIFDIIKPMRYAERMNVTVSLTPQFEQFLRQQLAEGHFKSEAEVIAAALRLLEFQSRQQDPASIHRHASDKIAIAAGESERRNLRGILADIRTDISAEDIVEARREMWSGFSADKA